LGNKDNNIIKQKSFLFASLIIKAYKYLTNEKKEFVLSKQLLRCGTSIGANIHEAQESISKKEFNAKIYISLKEARETEYWLLLLEHNEYFDMNKSLILELKDQCEEILKLLTSITKSLNRRNDVK
jgi:four helix bundle protein